MFGPLRSLACRLNQAAHGVPATVTRPYPDDTPIDTRVIWVTPETDTVLDQRADARLVLAVFKADVATVPRGTLVAAPEPGGTLVRVWRVDSTERVDFDRVHVVVTQEP